MRNLFRCIQVLLFNALHNTFRYCSFLTLLSFLQSFVLFSSLHIVLRDVHRRLKFLLGGILGGLLVLILTFIVQLGQQVCGVGFEPEYNRLLIIIKIFNHFLYYNCELSKNIITKNNIIILK